MQILTCADTDGQWFIVGAVGTLAMEMRDTVLFYSIQQAS